jgi:hypothetical protein
MHLGIARSVCVIIPRRHLRAEEFFMSALRHRLYVNKSEDKINYNKYNLNVM